MILAVGEALMEFRRESLDGELVSPGRWAGPFPSGAPAIFASVAARLGAPAALAACVGDDAFGRALIERLRRDGVDDEGIVTAPGRATPVALVAYRESGGRDFWFSVHDSAAMDLDAETAERLADRADWLHVSGSTLGFGGGPARAIEAAAARVLERGGRLSLDPNVRTSADERLRESVARLARSAHVLFPSEGELATLDLDPQELAGRGVVVCETRGRDGALLFDPEPVHVPVVPVDEVDPTGAGDTFAAAFVTALRAGDTASGGRGVRVPDGCGLRRRARRDGGAGRAVSGGLVLGIDVGTSSIKAAVFDTDGRDVAHSREPTPWRIGRHRRRAGSRRPARVHAEGRPRSARLRSRRRHRRGQHGGDRRPARPLGRARGPVDRLA